MYHAYWLVEGRVALLQGVGDQTLETIETSVLDLQRLLDAGQAPVHVVSDTRYMGKFPTSLKALGALITPHGKSGVTVVVGGNAVSKFISKMLTLISGGKEPVFRETIAEAVEYLQSTDATLPEVIPTHEQPVT